MYTFLLETKKMGSGLLSHKTPWEEFMDNEGIAVIVALALVLVMVCLVIYICVRDGINEKKVRNRQTCSCNEVVGLKDRCSIHLVFCYDGMEKNVEHSNGEVYVAEIPSRNGYIFKGWYKDSARTIPYTDAVVNNNLTLYAKWVKEAE